MPGVIRGSARLNRPSLLIDGGSIRTSEQNTDYVTVGEKTGEYSKGSISENE
jgi:Dihydroxyacid dehydratase/phosphogluconate dehydratase